MVKVEDGAFLFLDESALLNRSTVAFLHDLFAVQNIAVTVCVDYSLERPRDAVLSLMGASAFRCDGLLDILESQNAVRYAATKTYFDFSGVFALFDSGSYKQLIFLSERESAAAVFKEECENHRLTGGRSVDIVRLTGKEAVPWKIKKKKVLDAFFVEKGSHIFNKINVDKIEYVYSPRYRYLRLSPVDVKTGGEGRLYHTYQGMLVKIFSPEHISYINFKKLRIMQNEPALHPCINWPRSIVYSDGNPVGYCMEEIPGCIGLDELRISGFEGLQERDRYEIAVHILELIRYIHSKGMLIGDLKPDNILIRLPNEVFIIDCGSFQIGDYPCVVFHPHYTKKKYTEQELRRHLRTEDDEYFAINKILFEVLVGRTPNFDPDNPSVEVESDAFLYPLDVSDINADTHRTDLKRWAMMTQKMREMFYYYFTQERVSYLPEWIAELNSVIGINY